MWYIVTGLSGLVLGMLIGTQYANHLWREWLDELEGRKRG